MKVAVPLPDTVFRDADGLPGAAGVLYAEALAEYLAQHAADEVTGSMNGVVDRLGTASRDTSCDAGVRRVLANVES